MRTAQSHHTTSYFPAKVIGSEVIDRGPGTAADIGENTFGGTIGILSKDPRPDQAYGSDLVRRNLELVPGKPGNQQR